MPSSASRMGTNVIPISIYQKGSSAAETTITWNYEYPSDVDEHESDSESAMSDISREEMDAKFEAVEARLETRLVSMESKMDRLLLEVQRGVEIGKDAKDEAHQAKIAASNIKWNVTFTILTALGAIIAVMLTMWTISYQITDTVRSSITPQPSQITLPTLQTAPQSTQVTLPPSQITPQPSQITPQPSQITPQTVPEAPKPQ